MFAQVLRQIIKRGDPFARRTRPFPATERLIARPRTRGGTLRPVGVANTGLDVAKEALAFVVAAVEAGRQAVVARIGERDALLFDIPLLFETGGADAFDKVIVVSAPAELQRERVLARPGMTAAKLDAILARQLPDADKRARADYVIDTSGTFDETRAQVDAILACLGLATGV